MPRLLDEKKTTVVVAKSLMLSKEQSYLLDTVAAVLLLKHIRDGKMFSLSLHVKKRGIINQEKAFFWFWAIHSSLYWSQLLTLDVHSKL